MMCKIFLRKMPGVFFFLLVKLIKGHEQCRLHNYIISELREGWIIYFPQRHEKTAWYSPQTPLPIKMQGNGAPVHMSIERALSIFLHYCIPMTPLTFGYHFPSLVLRPNGLPNVPGVVSNRACIKNWQTEGYKTLHEWGIGLSLCLVEF